MSQLGHHLLAPLCVATGFHAYAPWLLQLGIKLLGFTVPVFQQLHQTVSQVDTSAPLGATDTPCANATVSGTVVVSGWTFDDVGIAKVEVLVDGVPDGTGTDGSPRPDIPAVYPGAPANSGYSYSLDTTKYSAVTF